MNTMLADDKNGQEEVFQIDLTDGTYCRLAKYAGRIGSLLESEQAKSNHALLGSLDDFLGVVYALIFAEKYAFKDRSSSPIEVPVVIKRAEHLAGGMVRTDGAWMAGFHLNSALFRMSAVYHRFLKIVVGKETGYVPALSPRAKKLYRKWKNEEWANSNIEGVYLQVNDLKHSPAGTHDGRRKEAGYENAVAAVSELLDLVEAWAASSTT